MKKTHRQLMKEFFYPDNLSDYNLPKNSELNKLIDKSYIINLKKDKHKLNRLMKNKNHKTFKNDFNEIGERALDNYLEWDTISKTDYEEYKNRDVELLSILKENP